MVLFPNCKINLGLHITHKREDGYHDLETVFYPVPWQDALEGIKSGVSSGESGVVFSTSGLAVEGNAEDNLCVKACHLLQKHHTAIGPVQLHLHKAIPMGAGLGGGSSDGAFTLTLLNQLFQLGLSQKQLLRYALELGSDCPFFILNKPLLAKGRGEKMEGIQLDLSAYSLVIVHPPVHVSTANAFKGITPRIPGRSIKTILQQPIETWKEWLTNDFEAGLCKQYPEIEQIKESLYNYGAIYASMTGSGSAVFGIFEKNTSTSFSFPSAYRIYQPN
ncbi:MAG: 4-(cytidine 5'-diphospho)-2-C-methyl-D-erythritol kinase [Sediminibacterium sp.]|nr:4-(cytidine 5'-diphospho)-2-C-methyl-D-erythritol kinase [Sediminibacterium sp.]MDP3127222.1 4-(cytidine 5'-diphospho)-2-C-methyl-D-erythritol kinase [Sediminibacterium sp.]